MLCLTSKVHVPLAAAGFYVAARRSRGDGNREGTGIFPEPLSHAVYTEPAPLFR